MFIKSNFAIYYDILLKKKQYYITDKLIIVNIGYSSLGVFLCNTSMKLIRKLFITNEIVAIISTKNIALYNRGYFQILFKKNRS